MMIRLCYYYHNFVRSILITSSRPSGSNGDRTTVSKRQGKPLFLATDLLAAGCCGRPTLTSAPSFKAASLNCRSNGTVAAAQRPWFCLRARGLVVNITSSGGGGGGGGDFRDIFSPGRTAAGSCRTELQAWTRAIRRRRCHSATARRVKTDDGRWRR